MPTQMGSRDENQQNSSSRRGNPDTENNVMWKGATLHSQMHSCSEVDTKGRFEALSGKDKKSLRKPE